MPAPDHRDYLNLLQPWPAFARRYIWTDPQRPDLACFGSGYDSWGVQTNQKFIGACAVMAAADELDEQAVGCSRDELLDTALRALRFGIASHRSGDHACADGANWGHTWISLLGVERMMHGVAAIEAHLTDADREGLRRMLISEADALLKLPITATRWAADRGNRPESNLWNGAFLWRAAHMYPDAERVERWTEKAHRFMLNGISVTEDFFDHTEVAGRAITDWHVGANFFDNYALDHHGYLNVGYMVICLSNIAMLYFSCLERGWPLPDSLHHRAADLWGLVRRLIFADGRLLRIGGDSRQRYCYCQDYLLPTLLWAGHHLGDPHAPLLEAGALELIRAEQAANSDGSFLSQRLASIRTGNPYYYTRLESDKAVVLSMGAWWRRTMQFPRTGLSGPDPSGAHAARVAFEFEQSAAGSWAEPEHGAMLHRSPRRVASWSWRAHDPPQGLCLPPDDGHLAEWEANMGGLVRLLGEQGRRKVLHHSQAGFEGGFVTTGTMADSEQAVIPEGWRSPDRALHHYAVAALPDERTMIVLEHCRLGPRMYLEGLRGLKLNVPNDIFNSMQRTYHTAAGSLTVRGDGAAADGSEGRWEGTGQGHSWSADTHSGWVGSRGDIQAADDTPGAGQGYGPANLPHPPGRRASMPGHGWGQPYDAHGGWVGSRTDAPDRQAGGDASDTAGRSPEVGHGPGAGHRHGHLPGRPEHGGPESAHSGWVGSRPDAGTDGDSFPEAPDVPRPPGPWQPVEGSEERLLALHSRWVCVEDRIGAVGIYGADGFSLYQAGHRRASGYSDSLYYDELCFPCRAGVFTVDPDTVVLDCGSAVLSGADRDETAQAADSAMRLDCEAEQMRAVRVTGADGRVYVLAANFGTLAVEGRISLGEGATQIWTRLGETADQLQAEEGLLRVSLASGEALLVVGEG